MQNTHETAPTVAEIIADMLAYEAEAFDEDEEVDGSDLVGAFAAWRGQLRTALESAPIPEAVPGLLALIQAGDNLAGLVEDAETQHIYDFDSGDEQPDDCAYKVGREAWDAAKEGASPPAGVQVVIVIKGGMVENAFAYGLPGGAKLFVADRDGDCEEKLVLHRAPVPPHNIAPAPLTICCDLEEDSFGVLSAPVGDDKLAEDPIRPGEFEKAIMANYIVTEEEAGEFHSYSPSDDQDNHLGQFATERAAWEAADNHRMFGNIAGPT